MAMSVAQYARRQAVLQPGQEVRPSGLDCGFVGVGDLVSNIRCRALVMPDWQGAETDYAKRMSRLFGTALLAETLIFNPYAARAKPIAYPGEGEKLVREVMARDRDLRHWLVSALEGSVAASLWSRPDLPLVLVGFCLGGTLAFEAARAGAPVSSAVSLHGTPAVPGSAKAVRPEKISMHLIMGGDDKLIPRRTVEMFLGEMRRSQRVWSMHSLGMEGHSFTKEEVGHVGPYSRYSPQALNKSVELVKVAVQLS